MSDYTLSFTAEEIDKKLQQVPADLMTNENKIESKYISEEWIKSIVDNCISEALGGEY